MDLVPNTVDNRAVDVSSSEAEESDNDEHENGKRPTTLAHHQSCHAESLSLVSPQLSVSSTRATDPAPEKSSTHDSSESCSPAYKSLLSSSSGTSPRNTDLRRGFGRK